MSQEAKSQADRPIAYEHFFKATAHDGTVQHTAVVEYREWEECLADMMLEPKRPWCHQAEYLETRELFYRKAE